MRCDAIKSDELLKNGEKQGAPLTDITDTRDFVSQSPQEVFRMNSYIRHLNAMLEEEAALAAKRNLETTMAARARLTPLEDRLARLLKSIPMELQREGLSLASIQSSLQGRWRGNCHPGELGTALRRLGFQRKRQWRGDEGFKALWVPNL